MDTSSSNVPAFLSKLWMLVEEESTDELICWDPVSMMMMTFLMLTISDFNLKLFFNWHFEKNKQFQQCHSLRILAAVV